MHGLPDQQHEHTCPHCGVAFISETGQSHAVHKIDFEYTGKDGQCQLVLHEYLCSNPECDRMFLEGILFTMYPDVKVLAKLAIPEFPGKHYGNNTLLN